jgi:hypothetical protein
MLDSQDTRLLITLGLDGTATSATVECNSYRLERRLIKLFKKLDWDVVYEENE